MGVRDSTGWRIAFVCGITIGAMAVTLFSYEGQRRKTERTAEFNRRKNAEEVLDRRVRKAADADGNGYLSVQELRSVAKVAGYEGPFSGIDSIIIYDSKQIREFDGGMFYSRSDMYLKGRTLHLPARYARIAEKKLSKPMKR